MKGTTKSINTQTENKTNCVKDVISELQRILLDRLGKIALLNGYLSNEDISDGVSSGEFDGLVFTEIANMVQEEHAALQQAFDLTAKVA